ncbi:hypothetical protein QBC39DRAFT_105355 [Podospora conica]|nr:hypothetical protein QBC39DRAFT_105355 [Schizothecium conicum]
MMTGLFTSTLTQQAIQYPLVQAVSTNASDVATVDRVTIFSGYDGHKLTLAPHGNVRQQQALFQGAFAVPSEPIPEVQPVCSSGDCKWPPYGSLAVCGGVANLTALDDKKLLAKLANMTEKRLNVLFNATQSTAAALGYDATAYFRLVPHVFPLIVGVLDKPTGAFNRSVTDLMASDSFIAYTDELLPNALPFDMSRVRYLEMAYWWCTKAYQTNVTAGKATTVELATRSQLTKPARTLNMPWAPEFYPCYATETCNTTYGGDMAELEAPPGTADGPSVNYTLHVWSELTASSMLAITMFDQVFFDHNRGVLLSNGGGVSKAFGPSLFGDFLSSTMPAPERQLENMRSLVSNAARVRQGAPGVNPHDPFAYVNGSVMTAQAVVEIHWEWTSMLVAQLGLATVFLCLTISATSRARMQILKCSSLATLCALDEGARREVGGIGDLEGLDEKARRFGVRLERDSSGVALSLGDWKG